MQQTARLHPVELPRAVLEAVTRQERQTLARLIERERDPVLTEEQARKEIARYPDSDRGVTP